MEVTAGDHAGDGEYCPEMIQQGHSLVTNHPATLLGFNLIRQDKGGGG